MSIKELVGALPPTSHTPLDTVHVHLLIGQIQLNNGNAAGAFNLFALAAQSGKPQALNMLGRAYEQGWGVKRSAAHAVLYFQSAAEQDYGWAYFNLADLYLAGDGVPQDTEKAFTYYVQAARKGVSKALNMLGTLHENGSIAGQADLEKACQYFKAGAEAGDCWAAFNMGRILYTHQKYDQAAQWFEYSLPLGFMAYWQALKMFLLEHDGLFLKEVYQKTIQFCEPRT